MKTTTAIVSSVVVYVLGWIVVAFLLYGYGHTQDYEAWWVPLIWFIAPGVAAYFAVKLPAERFKGVSVKTIFVGLVSVLVSLWGVILLIYLHRHPSASGFFGLLVGVAQAALSVVGANIARKEMVRESTDEIELTSEDYRAAHTPTRLNRLFDRLGARLSKLDDWLEKNGPRAQKPFCILIAVISGLYALENKSWLAGIICLVFIAGSERSNTKKPD